VRTRLVLLLLLNTTPNGSIEEFEHNEAVSVIITSLFPKQLSLRVIILWNFCEVIFSFIMPNGSYTLVTGFDAFCHNLMFHRAPTSTSFSYCSLELVTTDKREKKELWATGRSGTWEGAIRQNPKYL